MKDGKPSFYAAARSFIRGLARRFLKAATEPVSDEIAPPRMFATEGQYYQDRVGREARARGRRNKKRKHGGTPPNKWGDNNRARRNGFKRTYSNVGRT